MGRRSKKDVWLRPGKPLNAGTIWAGVGFLAYLVMAALKMDAAAWCVCVVFGVFAAYVFLSAVMGRREKKESVTYSQLWGTFALTALLIGIAVLTVVRT